ncbi:SPX domain-containing protein 1-like [Olea europaea var. sylvestris]|uniref:SPX domain-containing protein 1-like n=1 Tax=Olea europaea var. sylvestris TaxID=158386 RepID=UPI000C1CEA88|nr:SPX domain-containing protein 1-like [Olea europaea var. sylvestris]
MKFWKILCNQINETLPDWQDKFLSYKDLKKRLKLIYPKQGSCNNHENSDIYTNGRPNKRPRLSDDEKEVGDSVCGGDDDGDEVTKEVTDFLERLEKEIEKFNRFFVDKEEFYIIRLQMLKEEVAEAKDSEVELMKIGRKIVDFHGEMILLENYSALNYTGLVKILKKYDKRSGELMRLPFIQKVLHEPFFRTEVLNNLVNDCEIMIYGIFSWHEQLTPPEEIGQKEGCSDWAATEDSEKLLRLPEELSAIENMENMYMRLTMSALRTLREIRSGSSTVSMFSLPPMQGHDLDEFGK